MSPFTFQSVYTVISGGLTGGQRSSSLSENSPSCSLLMMRSSNGVENELLWRGWTTGVLSVFIHAQCHLWLLLYICCAFEDGLSVMSAAHEDISGFLSLISCLVVSLPQVRCVWTDPAPAREGLDPPGHCQALSLSSWVSALILISRGGVNRWSVVSAVWVWFPVVPPEVIFSPSVCVCGGLEGRWWWWGGSCAWLRKLSSNQERIIANKQKNTVSCALFLMSRWKWKE